MDEGDAEYNLLADTLALDAHDTASRPNLHDRVYFIEAMTHNYNVIAEKYRCACEMSARRLGEAFDYWKEDAKRTFDRGMDDGTPTLDHFKHASFIAFWLRRTVPINRTLVNRPVGSDTSDTQKFIQFGNEICVLFIGLQICLFYEMSRLETQIADAGAIRIGRLDEKQDRFAYLRTIHFPPELLDDFAMILKHKNMSPYAVYLLYKSLFNTLIPRADDAVRKADNLVGKVQ